MCLRMHCLPAVSHLRRPIRPDPVVGVAVACAVCVVIVELCAAPGGHAVAAACLLLPIRPGRHTSAEAVMCAHTLRAVCPTLRVNLKMWSTARPCCAWACTHL